MLVVDVGLAGKKDQIDVVLVVSEDRGEAAREAIQVHGDMNTTCRGECRARIEEHPGIGQDCELSLENDPSLVPGLDQRASFEDLPSARST